MAFLALVAGPRLAPGSGDDPAAPHLHHRAPPSLHPHQVGQLLVSIAPSLSTPPSSLKVHTIFCGSKDLVGAFSKGKAKILKEKDI